MRSGPSFSSYIANQIAYSCLFFNEVNILESRERYIPIIIDYFKEAPLQITRSIIISLRHLNEKAVEEINHVEPYSYGDVSRNHWLSKKGEPLNDPSVTGIEGTDKIGMNSHQESWSALNRAEDQKEEFDRGWELAAFQASAWNSDGVQKVRKKRDKKMEEEEARREALYESRGQRDIDTSKKRIHILRESPEELLDEMERNNRGEEDFHDKVVNKYEGEIRKGAIEREKEWQEKKIKAKEKRKEKTEKIDADGEMVVIDEDEIQEKVQEQEQKRIEKREKGNYTDRSDFEFQKERLQKWNIIEGADELEETGKERAKRLKGESEKEETEEEEEKKSKEGVPSSMEGTILEDHYKQVDNDLKNPDKADLPDIIDDE